MKNLSAQPQPATSNIKNSSHNHNYNQTNPKKQPKPETKPKTQPPNLLVHTKHPQPQLKRNKPQKTARKNVCAQKAIQQLPKRKLKHHCKGSNPKRTLPTLQKHCLF
jgi:hypothetical protein